MTTPPMPDIADFDRTKDGTPAWCHYAFALQDYAKQGWAEAERLRTALQEANGQRIKMIEYTEALRAKVAELERDLAHGDEVWELCKIAYEAQVAELAGALEKIANEPAVMGPDGHWCQGVAIAALDKVKP